MIAVSLVRVLGGLTASYGAYTLIRPTSLARVMGIEHEDPADRRPEVALGRQIGLRDVFSGISMVAAPQGPLLGAAVIARVASDVADVISLGSAAPPRTRAKVITIAALWGAVCASTIKAAGRK